MTETPAPKPEPEPVPAPAPEQPKPEPPKPAETPKPTPKPAPKIEPSHVAFDPFYDRSEALADNGGWNVLEIVEAGSQQGMTMKRLADGSVLFTGAMTPHGDTCTLTARTTLKNVTGFRFDALLDEDHPDAGPAHNSIIVVNELAATVASKGQTAPPEPVKFANAKATTHSKDWEPSRLLDDKASTGWASSHETIKQPQHLLLTCDSPIGDGDMTTLRFTLKFRKPTEAMRRIQISATTAADPLTLDATPAPLVRRDRIAFVPLHPQHAESKDKATMTIQEDQSVLVDAKHTSPDVYTVMFETSLANISAFELEALTDDSLRDNGPGTAIGGRFTLSEFEMTIAPKSNPSAGQAVKFDRAMADYSSEKFPVEHAIDGNAKTPWFVNDRPGESRTAVFIPASPVGVEGGSVIIVTLQQQRMNLGRFRLRATTADDPAALAPEPIEATPEKTDKPAPAAEKSDGAQDVRLFFNAGGSDAEWSGAKWVTAPTYKKGAAGYDLAQGGRSFDAKTVNNPVTDTCLLKIEAFRATVPNGRYKVTLVFAELTESTDAGHRKFSVLAESKPVRNFMNIDPFADGKGRGSPSTRSAVITVSDGVLDLEFKGVAADTTPILNAVSIIGLR
jgi:hypothetical protein